MIEHMMKEILMQNQGYLCLSLDCKSITLKNIVLEHLNTLCEKHHTVVQHYAPINNTIIVIPDIALQYFSQLCLGRKYTSGPGKKLLDISELVKQFFPPETYVNPVEEFLLLKQKVEKLEQENTQLKFRMAKLEGLVEQLLNPLAYAHNRYHFYPAPAIP